MDAKASESRNLRLRRPLVFVDIEATGISPPLDRIVELALLKLDPTGAEEVLTFRVNPGIPIPEDAIAVHGITNEDVALEPVFRDFAAEVERFLDGCDLAGFNITRFDFPMLEAEMRRGGKHLDRKGRAVVDAMTIYHANERRDLQSAVSFYCEEELQGAHTALADARASMNVLQAQLRRYERLPLDVDALQAELHPQQANWVDDEGRFIWSDEGATFNFGRHRGKTVKDVAENEPSYLEWLIDEEFPQAVTKIAKLALNGEYPDAPRQSE